MVKMLLLGFCIIFLSHASAQECQIKSCSGTHIDCEMGSGDWGKSCPANKNMLNLAAVTDQIVARHNERRNRIAGGLVSGFDPAVRMGLMQWNITLANLCRKNVRQCIMKHDQCHNTEEYDFSGQNLAYKKFKKTVTTSNIDILLELTDLWYSEISNAAMADFNLFKGTKDIDSVAQMLRDYSDKVGCAASVLEDATWKTIIYCCNYNMGNIYNWYTYKKGTAASACKTGKDSTYKNLCSASEVYNQKTFWKD